MPFRVSNSEAIERLLGECERHGVKFSRTHIDFMADAIRRVSGEPEVRCAHVAEALHYQNSGGIGAVLRAITTHESAEHPGAVRCRAILAAMSEWPA